MPNPEVKTFNPFTWVKVATAVRRLFLYRVETTNFYYRTYRLTGQAAPDPISSIDEIEGSKAILLFADTIYEEFRSSEAVDVYVLCGSGREVPTQGKILVGPIDDSRDVNLQDQTSDPVVFEFFEEQGETTLAADASFEEREITVTDDTGIVVGTLLHILDTVNNRGIVCHATGPGVGLVVPIDRPLDFDYAAGSKVIRSTTNMNVDGSTGTNGYRIYKIRTSNYDVPEDFDITNIRFFCTCNGGTELNLFADKTALIRGITIRKKNPNGTYRNLVNFKSNVEMKGLLGIWEPYGAINPGTGINGFFAEWKLAGQENQGVADRAMPGGDIELFFDENLGGTITLLKGVAIGHVVAP